MDEAELVRLKDDCAQFKRAYHESNAQCVKAYAERDEMKDRAAKYIAKADQTIADLQKALQLARKKANAKLYELGKLTEPEINAILDAFPPTIG